MAGHPIVRGRLAGGRGARTGVMIGPLFVAAGSIAGRLFATGAGSTCRPPSPCAPARPGPSRCVARRSIPAAASRPRVLSRRAGRGGTRIALGAAHPGGIDWPRDRFGEGLRSSPASAPRAASVRPGPAGGRRPVREVLHALRHGGRYRAARQGPAGPRRGHRRGRPLRGVGDTTLVVHSPLAAKAPGGVARRHPRAAAPRGETAWPRTDRGGPARRALAGRRTRPAARCPAEGRPPATARCGGCRRRPPTR